VSAGFELRDPGHPAQVNQQAGANPDPEPEDARKATEEQREVQEDLDHQGGDSNGPGQQQSRHNTAGESTR